MNNHNLDDFIDEITLLEDFFTEFSAREEEIIKYGMERVTKWDSYSRAEKILQIFETQVHEFQSFLRPIDKSLYQRVLTLISESKLIESMIGIAISLRIAAQKQRVTFKRELSYALKLQFPFVSNSLNKKKLFSEEDIPIQTLLIALGRLKSLIGISKDMYINQRSQDSDLFKPSNLEDEKVVRYIEKAIDCIEAQSLLPPVEKKQLIDYLYKAKSEFSKDKPSWNNIVGALVIAAAIISGIADSNDAMKNIDSAIQYILGSSVEKHIPNSIPLLKQPEIKEDNPYEPKTVHT